MLRRLDLPRSGGENVFYLRTIDDSELTHRTQAAGIHLLVIEAGFIGPEIAAMADRSGCPLSVIEATG